jgi:hypothetical protein
MFNKQIGLSQNSVTFGIATLRLSHNFIYLWYGSSHLTNWQFHSIPDFLIPK